MPPLDLEHLKRLHNIVETGACITNRLGAAITPLEFALESLHVAMDAESVKEEQQNKFQRPNKFHFSAWISPTKVSLKLIVHLAVTAPVIAQAPALMSRSFQGLRCMLTQKMGQMDLISLGTERAQLFTK